MRLVAPSADFRASDKDRAVDLDDVSWGHGWVKDGLEDGHLLHMGIIHCSGSILEGKFAPLSGFGHTSGHPSHEVELCRRCSNL